MLLTFLQINMRKSSLHFGCRVRTGLIQKDQDVADYFQDYCTDTSTTYLDSHRKVSENVEVISKNVISHYRYFCSSDKSSKSEPKEAEYKKLCESMPSSVNEKVPKENFIFENKFLEDEYVTPNKQSKSQSTIESGEIEKNTSNCKYDDTSIKKLNDKNSKVIQRSYLKKMHEEFTGSKNSSNRKCNTFMKNNGQKGINKINTKIHKKNYDSLNKASNQDERYFPKPSNSRNKEISNVISVDETNKHIPNVSNNKIKEPLKKSKVCNQDISLEPAKPNEQVFAVLNQSNISEIVLPHTFLNKVRPELNQTKSIDLVETSDYKGSTSEHLLQNSDAKIKSVKKNLKRMCIVHKLKGRNMTGTEKEHETINLVDKLEKNVSKYKTKNQPDIAKDTDTENVVRCKRIDRKQNVVKKVNEDVKNYLTGKSMQLIPEHRNSNNLVKSKNKKQSQTCVGKSNENSGNCSGRKVKLKKAFEPIAANEVRRSNRHRYAPFDHWRNERLLYRFENGEIKVLGIDKGTTEDKTALMQLQKSFTRKKECGKKKVKKAHVEENVIAKVNYGFVKKFSSVPWYKSEGISELTSYHFKTVFELSNCAFGFIAFDGFQKIPTQYTQDDLQMTVLKGQVEVTIQDDNFKLVKKDMFVVPRGIAYSLKNLTCKKALLSVALGKFEFMKHVN